MKKKLLAIDDDPDIIRVLKANLELFGYEAVTAGSISDANKSLEIMTPALILLDVSLPDGNGMDYCRDLKQRFPEVPIIMLTARDRVADKVTGLESGADDYVVKPFEAIELAARIKACLRRYSPGEEKAILGGLSIDYKARTVELDGSQIDLTPREYELLCLLVSNRGQALSREFIRKSLWKESGLYSWSRVIDVHIQHLRQKIEKDPLDPEYIVTVPGFGYKLNM